MPVNAVERCFATLIVCEETKRALVPTSVGAAASFSELFGSLKLSMAPLKSGTPACFIKC